MILSTIGGERLGGSQNLGSANGEATANGRMRADTSAVKDAVHGAERPMNKPDKDLHNRGIEDE